MSMYNEEANEDANSLIQYSPGALVVSRPSCGGKRVGAEITVIVSEASRLSGEVIAFFDANMKRTTYKRSAGAVIRPTAYGAGHMVSDSGFVKVCWEV
jgi:hypothetical protein